ncbi:type 1 glutamine amidotransferase [Companilactobacillus alimentarius]|uniref:type 1 glutamine amidotransferase n=1 Tax=Companilactobacillus alimentarius TaxID=1602 RepID=UPI0028BAAB61|nr:type 1 glutamine amidotransferase [Companilactobacillus alimentarius]MDT6952677.1 type 1 glutamine amidotransferase [Companilactobacillus alimentarius]
MRINVLQHTPNEGPGMIQDWSQKHGHEMYIYHPYQFGYLPTAEETDLLVILGGPMSPNDNLSWIKQERDLIKELLNQNKPLFGVCFGAQQITKALGYEVSKAPAKEVGFAPVYRRDAKFLNIPEELNVLHWHEEMFEIPADAQLLFSSDRVENQGFILNHRVVGLQFHLEPKRDNVREIVVNDFPYLKGSVLNQTSKEILETRISDDNKQTLYKLLDYIVEK